MTRGERVKREGDRRLKEEGSLMLESGKRALEVGVKYQWYVSF